MSEHNQYCVYGPINPIVINSVRQEVLMSEGITAEDVACCTLKELYEMMIPDQKIMSMSKFSKELFPLGLIRSKGRRSLKDEERAARVIDHFERGWFDASGFFANSIIVSIESLK